MVAVDKVINIYDSRILWFRIPGFPGYEISNTHHYVRSFKSRKRYPYGTLVQWAGKNRDYIVLTNSNNQRVKLTLDDILKLTHGQIGYKTFEVQNTSRNPLCGIDTNATSEVGKIVAKPKIQISEDKKFVDFSNIPDIDLNN